MAFILKVAISGAIYIIVLTVQMLISKLVLKNGFCDELLDTVTFVKRRK